MVEFVVAIDGSEISGKVVDFAAKLAKAHGAKAVLMHVIPPLAVPVEFGHYTNPEVIYNYVNHMRQVGQQSLAIYGKRFADAGVECEILLEEDNPAGRILAIAKQRKAEIIVMGFVGLHGLGRIRVLGSVSRKVIEGSDRPILIVPA